LGRKPEAVAALQDLAMLCGIRVVEFSPSWLCMSRESPCFFGFDPTPLLPDTDWGLLLDVDVPWLPHQTRPLEETRWVHIDVDPIKKDFPSWGFASDERWPADCALALRDIYQAVLSMADQAYRQKVAERMASHLSDRGADLAFIYKRRPKGTTNVAEAREVMGDVEGRLCILNDDMIDSGGTIVSAADVLMARGAKEVWAMATHAVLSGPAIDRLKNSVISRVVLTNTLPLPSEKQIDKIEVLSIAPLIADALNAVFDDSSVSEIFGGENQA
jgi:hypothetical protein